MLYTEKRRGLRRSRKKAMDQHGYLDKNKIQERIIGGKSKYQINVATFGIVIKIY